MVSIGVFIKLLLFLIPLILCTNEGFKKISDKENEKIQQECGHLTEISDAINKNPHGKPMATWISPHHFFTSIKALSHNYSELECGKSGNMVTKYYEPKAKFPAKVIGKCKHEGAVLVDTHAEYQNPQKKFFCLRKKVPTEKDVVDIVNEQTTHQGGVIVKCAHPKKSIFCVEMNKENVFGHVLVPFNTVHYLVGVVLGHVKGNKKILEVFSLGDHLDEICKTTGVCDIPPSKLLPVPTPPPVVTEPPTAAPNITVATTETPTTSEVTPSTDTPTTKAATTTAGKEEKASTTVTVPTAEKPATEPKDAPTPESKEKSTSSEPKQDSTTERPAVEASTSSDLTSSDAHTTEPDVTIPDASATILTDAPGAQPTPPPAPQLPTNTSGTPEYQKPQAEAQISPDFSDVDCEKENLCFDEDIFASASDNGILLIICIALVLMGF